MTRRRESGPVKNATTGKWEFTIDVGVNPATGKRRRAHRRGFDTKRAAQDELDDLRAKKKGGTYVAPSRQTVAEYLDEWLETRKAEIESSTHASYARNVRLHVKPRIGALQLQQLDGAALTKLYGDLLANGRMSG